MSQPAQGTSAEIASSFFGADLSQQETPSIAGSNLTPQTHQQADSLPSTLHTKACGGQKTSIQSPQISASISLPAPNSLVLEIPSRCLDTYCDNHLGSNT